MAVNKLLARTNGDIQSAGEAYFDDTNDRLGINESSPDTLLHVSNGSAGTAPSWTAARDNFILESSGDCYQQIFTTSSNIGAYAFATPSGAAYAYTAYVASQDHLVWGVTATAHMWLKNTGCLILGSNTQRNSNSQIELSHTPSDGTGADPTTLTLINGRNNNWTTGAAVHRIDFWSQDSSGAGAGVKSRIEARTYGTTGAGLGLAFSVDDGGGLAEVFRFDKDGRFQVAGAAQTGQGKISAFTGATNQRIFWGQMIASYANEIIQILDSSSADLFVVDNSANIQGGNGSATTPGHSFTGDTNTGMFRHAADELAFAVGGTERLKIVDSGELILTALDAVPADADLDNSTASFYLDETANELKVKVKYAAGTVKTGTVASLT